MVYQPDENRYQRMAFRRCGQSGLKLPAISLGLWHNFGDTTLMENSRALLQRAFDLGITHFDLANNYGPPPGSAERNFGRCRKIFYRGAMSSLSPPKRDIPCGTALTATGDPASI